MNKKGDGTSSLNMVIAIIIGLLVIYFASSFLFKGSKSSANVIGPAELKLRDKSCINKGSDAMERGIDFTDSDKDGRPDACDVCVKGTSGSNDKDKDLDGMPDDCDKDANDDTVFECSGQKTKDNRCT